MFFYALYMFLTYAILTYHTFIIIHVVIYFKNKILFINFFILKTVNPLNNIYMYF